VAEIPAMGAEQNQRRLAKIIRNAKESDVGLDLALSQLEYMSYLTAMISDDVNFNLIYDVCDIPYDTGDTDPLDMIFEAVKGAYPDAEESWIVHVLFRVTCPYLGAPSPFHLETLEGQGEPTTLQDIAALTPEENGERLADLISYNEQTDQGKEVALSREEYVGYVTAMLTAPTPGDSFLFDVCKLNTDGG
jgi:hypothetical protein